MTKIFLLLILLYQINTAIGQSGWSPLQSGTSYGLYSVFFINSNTGFVVGEEGTVLKTNNAGLTWTTEVSGTTSFLSSVYFTDTIIGFIVGTNNFTGGVVLKTTNGGTVWAPQIIYGTITRLNSVYFTDPNTGYAVGQGYIDSIGDYGVILKTVDAGVNWNALPNIFPVELSKVYFIDNNIGYVGGSPDLGYGVYKTTDGGNTWVKKSSIGSSIFFIDSNNGYLLHNTSILKTTDGGTTWVQQISGTSEQLNSIFFTDLNNGFIVGINGTILKTTNGGTTWEQQLNTSINGLYSIYFINANIGYATGHYGTILKTTTSGQSNINSNILSDKDVRIYPNPSIDEIVIEYNNTGNNVIISITDLSGNLIFEATTTNSYYVLKSKILKQGLYIVKIINCDKILLRKIEIL